MAKVQVWSGQSSAQEGSATRYYLGNRLDGFQERFQIYIYDPVGSP